jgi:hypothetical protein
VAVFVLGIGLSLALAGAASAGTVSKKDPAGDVKASGLTQKERAALDIRSITITGEAGLGVVVTVTFRGNLQAAIGRGHLRTALVGLLLEPKSSTQKAVALATRAAGRVGETLSSTASTQVGAVRRGNRLTFFVFGPGLENVGSISVRDFARVLPASLRPRPLRGGDSGAELVAALRRSPADGATQVAVLVGFGAPLSCDELEALADEIERLIDIEDGDYEDISPEEQTRMDAAYEALKKARTAVATRIREECPPIDELVGTAEWTLFGGSANEAVLSGEFNYSVTSPAAASSHLDAVRVVVPSRQITNFLCPLQLPLATVSTTDSTRDTLTCSGGTLPLGEQFQLNVRMSPGPTAGMGGRLFGREDGVFQGPFEITGP